MRYSDKVFDIKSQIAAVEDQRTRPRIETSRVVSSALVMALAQMGSLNELEQTQGYRFWHKWVGGDIPSADTMGRVGGAIACDGLREILKSVYTRMKRNKALKPAFDYGFALIVDGHESHSSYLRCCEGCLERVIHKSSGDQVQYYHRHVMAQLMCGNFYLPIDMEPQRPGEDEVAAAVRLLERVFKDYPRAFSIILADGLYVRAGFFQLAIDHGKDVIAVLKDERRDLLKDARGLFKREKSKTYRDGKVTRQCWDIEHFNSWPQLGHEVRVVRSIERGSVKRQRTKKIHHEMSEWAWVTTTPKKRLNTETFVKLAHGRWKIENEGFNELVNQWHANHVYRHHPVAIEAFWLLTMLAYVLFHAFIGLNLKPQIRDKYTKKHLAMLVTAELYPSEVFVPP